MVAVVLVVDYMVNRTDALEFQSLQKFVTSLAAF